MSTKQNQNFNQSPVSLIHLFNYFLKGLNPCVICNIHTISLCSSEELLYIRNLPVIKPSITSEIYIEANGTGTYNSKQQHTAENNNCE